MRCAKATPPTRVVATDRMGAFDIDAAAELLHLDKRYTKGLFMPMGKTYFVRGPVYPSEKSRASRPGSEATKDFRERRVPYLDRKYRAVDSRNHSTD